MTVQKAYTAATHDIDYPELATCLNRSGRSDLYPRLVSLLAQYSPTQPAKWKADLGGNALTTATDILGRIADDMSVDVVGAFTAALAKNHGLPHDYMDTPEFVSAQQDHPHALTGLNKLCALITTKMDQAYASTKGLVFED